MESNILLFLAFSVIALVIYYILPYSIRKYLLLVYSFIFYFICDFNFAWLILLLTLWSFYYGKFLVSGSRIRVVFGIIPVVLILCIFKMQFLFRNGNIGIMPLGLSYYSFKIISYLVDIYQKKRKPEENLVDYAIYVSIFTQIICGPISRSEEITEQLKQKLKYNSDLFAQGILLIISGLYKKMVIADRLSGYVNNVFGNYRNYSGLTLWMGAFCYTIQIYCDFAGYSEIVIGVTNLFGITCNKNFDMPYFSGSIGEFWRRWHISLSSFLRDYVYIPLGGNRCSHIRKKINILCTFLVSGFWHGEGLKYLAWGAWHGLWNLVEDNQKDKHKITKTLLTFICVMLGWVLFRADSIKDAGGFMAGMFCRLTITPNAIIEAILPFTGDYSCLAVFSSIMLCIVILAIFEWRALYRTNLNNEKESKVRSVIYLAAIIFFASVGQNSFLYANY